MEEIENKKSIEKNEPEVKKDGSKVTVFLFVLSGIQFILIIILFNQIHEHSHWNYAKESHSHYSSDVPEHYHNYANTYHTHTYEHEHSAGEIKYNSFEYGGYGTLQSKLNEIDDEHSDLEDEIRMKIDFHEHPDLKRKIDFHEHTDLERKIRMKADGFHFH